MRYIKFILVTAVINIIFFAPFDVYAKVEFNRIGSVQQNLDLKEKVATKRAEIVDKRVENLKNRANTEIDKRVKSLNEQITGIQFFKKISDSDKTNLINQIQKEITDMESIRTKIQSDTDLNTLRTDVQSVTKNFRVYLLFMPRIAILGAADRVFYVSDNMTSEEGKLQDRIKVSGLTSLQTTLDDAKAKIASARTGAQNAIDLVLPLNPDNGDKTVLESNLAALKSAREEFKKAHQDLITVMKDFKEIVKWLKKVSPTVTPTTSV
jgi:hypothetical protein